jgi:hypothetical protein
MYVQSISPQAVLPIRQEILRPGAHRQDCKFEGDLRKGTLHFGVFSKNQLIGVATLLVSESTFYKTGKCYQLRGMAIRKKYQRTGAGHFLMQYILNHCRQQKVEKIWWNARVKAVPFYLKFDTEITSEIFTIAGIGEHYKMQKVF